MLDKILKIVGIIAGLAIAASFAFSGGALAILGAGNGSTSHTASQFDALGGFSVNGTVVADASGRVTGAVSTTQITLNGGTAFTNFICGTASFSVPALSPFKNGSAGATSVTTTTVTVTGAVVGDIADASWNPPSTTSTLNGVGVVMGNPEVASTSIAVVSFVNDSTATSTALATSTIKVCTTH